MNIPNLITLFRLFLVPVFVLVFFSKVPNSIIISVVIFLTAGATDILDGYIARKYNLVTKWGIVIDPLADKLMLLSALTCLVLENYVPIWVIVIIASKELFMILAGLTLYHKNVLIPANKFGKITTCLFYAAIFLIALDVPGGDYLLYFAVCSALFALVIYLIGYLKQKKYPAEESHGSEYL